MGSLSRRWRCALAVALAFTVLVPNWVSAQEKATPVQDKTKEKSPFDNLRSGDCRVALMVPKTASIGTLRLLRNGNETTAVPQMTGKITDSGEEVVFTVLEPPQFGDQFQVTGLGVSLPAVPVDMQGPNRSRCNVKDERDVFATTLLFGVAADAFAPNEERFYLRPNDPDPDPQQDPFKLRNSMIVRIDAALRVGGNHGGPLDRFWVAVAMKYGVRSTDLDCADKDKDAPNCTNSAFVAPKDPGARLTAAVLRASKIEAVVKPRYEFKTLYPDSESPVALYALGRFGFGQAPGEVKVENVYSAGAGFMFLSGVFRDSGVETTVGVDRGYRTNPNGGRVRSDFKLMFGKAPGFLGQIPYLAKLAQAPRGLVEVVVDRNSFGPGPDGTQTFLGVVLDIQKVLP